MKRYIDPIHLKISIALSNILEDGKTLEEIIDSIPSEDVVEVKHGHWIKGENAIHCSVCGYKTSALIPYIDNGGKWIPLYANKYCGNCGAKMEDE